MPKKRHVTLDARLVFASGIGTFIQSILFELSKRKEWAVSILHFTKDSKFFERYPNFTLIPVKSAIYSLKEQIELPLKIPKCDLFWTPHFNIPVLPIRAKKRMATIHDTYHLTFFSSLSVMEKGYAKCIYNAACRLSDLITTISDYSQKEILERCSVKKEKVKVIKLGAKPGFKPLEKDLSLHQKFQLPSVYALAVTNYKPHKNFPRILKACQKVCPLIVVGEKRSMEGAKATGYLDEHELNYLYSHASLLVFPSLYEGYGLPLREAMAAGCPVVTSREACLPEVCEDAAEYVDAYDEVSIQKGIERVLNDKEYRHNLIEKGLHLAKKYTLEHAAVDYIKAVENLME